MYIDSKKFSKILIFSLLNLLLNYFSIYELYNIFYFKIILTLIFYIFKMRFLDFVTFKFLLNFN